MRQSNTSHSHLMKTTTSISYLALFLVLAALASSCKKDKKSSNPPEETPGPVANNRQVKYKITGNYTGQMFVVYNDNISGNKTDTVKSLPWSKDVIYANNVSGIGIAANSVSGYLGQPFQSAVIEIYSAGNLVKSQSGTSDANGIINIQSVAYVFP